MACPAGKALPETRSEHAYAVPFSPNFSDLLRTAQKIRIVGQEAGQALSQGCVFLRYGKAVFGRADMIGMLQQVCGLDWGGRSPTRERCDSLYRSGVL